MKIIINIVLGLLLFVGALDSIRCMHTRFAYASVEPAGRYRLLRHHHRMAADARQPPHPPRPRRQKIRCAHADAAIRRSSKYVYDTGTTTSVKIVAVVIPPTSVLPKGP